MSLRKDGSDASTAERLAQSLRSGLELRWSIPSPDAEASTCFPPSGSVRPFLERHANLLHYPLPHRLHPLFRFVRALRQALRKLISPWLDVQTRFNLSAVSVLEQVEQRIQSLEETERTLRQSIEALEQSLASHAAGERSKQITNEQMGENARVGVAGVLALEKL